MAGVTSDEGLLAALSTVKYSSFLLAPCIGHIHEFAILPEVIKMRQLRQNNTANKQGSIVEYCCVRD